MAAFCLSSRQGGSGRDGVGQTDGRGGRLPGGFVWRVVCGWLFPVGVSMRLDEQQATFSQLVDQFFSPEAFCFFPPVSGRCKDQLTGCPVLPAGGLVPNSLQNDTPIKDPSNPPNLQNI